MKNYYFLLLFSLFYSQLEANHLAAGTISYEYLSPMTYKVHLLLYQDCGPLSSFANAGTAYIGVNSVSTGQSLFLYVDTTGNNTRTIVPDMCASVVNWCIDPTSTFPGYEEWHYTGFITLPVLADDWEFSFGSCCRNAAINNLASPSSLGYTYIAKLNNLTAAGNLNNSVQFVVGNGYTYLVNQAYNINQFAIDPDGDSLVFSLTNPLDISGSGLCPYIATGGYSATTPFGTPTATNYANIDPITGNFSFKNALLGVDVVAIQIDEYRNGIQVGSTIRDLQFSFINGGANSLPTLSGVNGGANYFTSVNVCSGSSLNFTVIGSDVDAADSVIITPVTTLMGNSTFSTNNALQQTGEFSWTPTISDVQPSPYLLVLQAEDNNCHSVTYGYLIYVSQCTSDSVWAGDANDDFTVDNYDALNIGISNGTTGIVRPAATTNWMAEYCPNWTNSFMSGVNYKHADCNGDGIIDVNDLNSVLINYGQIHFKNNNIGVYKQLGFPDLYFDLTGLIANAGNTIQVPVMLGTNILPSDSIYGIAGHIIVSNSLSGPMVLDNSISWMGNSSNTFLFQKSISSNDLAFTLVRNDHQNVNGFGQIATLNIPISSLASNGSQLNINFSDIKFIEKNGNELTDFNVINDSMNIQSNVQVTNLELEKSILIYPNPVTDEVYINFSNLQQVEINRIEIRSIKGEVIYDIENPVTSDHTLKLSTKNLTNGTYLIKMNIGNQVLTKKLVKL